MTASNPPASSPTTMRTFWTIWIGQVISLIGSGMTGFALGVFIFEQTGKATPFALTIFFANLPRVLLSPIAGAVADRYNRRLIMIAADSGAALATLAAAILIFTTGLEVWHIYLIAFTSSVFGAFQEPAYMASITMIVPREQLGRASGMVQATQAVEFLVPPVLAGVLFGLIGLRGIILIDLITFFAAVGALLIVHVPQPKASQAAEAARGSMLQEALFGWRYITARAGLLSMLLYFAMVNFFANFAAVLMPPLVLSFSGPAALGLVQMAGGIGMLGGSIAMGAWGGPKRKMLGVYLFIALGGIGMLVVGVHGAFWTTALGMFLFLFMIPLASGCSTVIWQTKVEPDIQGRVFAMRGMLSRSIMPVAFLSAGPLADRVFEPLMSEGGALAPLFGNLIGVGPGRGIGLLFMASGLLIALVTLLAYSYPRMRLVEDELPDVVIETVEEAAGEAPDLVAEPAVL